jgi:hypothetical protein
MWSGYTLLHTLAYIYKFHGMSQEGAMWMSVVMSTLVMNGFEFVDGFTQFGFEYADAIANTAGIALGALTWIYPSLFDLISFRLAYVPTNDFLDNETSLVKFINDYSGQIYYLDIRGHGVNQLLNKVSLGRSRFFDESLFSSTSQRAEAKVVGRTCGARHVQTPGRYFTFEYRQ